MLIESNFKRILKEEPTNSTSNVYPETSEVPNQDLIDFEAIMTGGQRLGFSGADGNTAGGAIIGTLEPPHFQAGLEGSFITTSSCYWITNQLQFM